VKQLIPARQREFAVEVVRQLREHHFEAYWAGGCVRDHLLSRIPYDYDVATSAHPEEIRSVFHHRKTLAIGAAFGVMTVVGPRGAGQVEVTTFRQDVSYSDGRHPDRISFSSPEEDAKRRDFTINGMFYDPLAERIIDFVGGEADLRQGLVRAIGQPRERFTEDKLRMLRAIRFASIFGFRLEQHTAAAICEMAPQVTVVSAERIADELRIMLVHSSRARAVQLMHAMGLLAAILPEVDSVAGPASVDSDADVDPRQAGQNSSPWPQALAMLHWLGQPSFSLALAALLHSVTVNDLAEVVGRRWRLARKEIELLAWLLEHQRDLAGASAKPWSQIQPLLSSEDAGELVELHDVQAKFGLVDPSDVAFCRQQLERPAVDLDPPPLVSGADLIAQGIPRGPVFAKLLQLTRDAQLDGVVGDRAAALEFVQNAWRNQSPDRP
jgi:tRNA nucleotidyltransferase/poly(A) polymerase